MNDPGGRTVVDIGGIEVVARRLGPERVLVAGSEDG
jgi:hypothetical protein